MIWEKIKVIAEIVGAILLITGAIHKICKPIKDLIDKIKTVLEKIEKLEKHQGETYLQTLRLVICSEEIPLEERIAAGDKYIALGGNGAVKHLYQELVDSLPTHDGN